MFSGLLADEGVWLQKGPLLKIFHTYLTMMEFITVVPYLKKTLKAYESHDPPLIPGDTGIYSPEISKFGYIKKYSYILHFGTSFIIFKIFLE